eukprot:2200646-Prymnesium_polylepis.2
MSLPIGWSSRQPWPGSSSGRSHALASVRSATCGANGGGEGVCIRARRQAVPARVHGRLWECDARCAWIPAARRAAHEIGGHVDRSAVAEAAVVLGVARAACAGRELPDDAHHAAKVWLRDLREQELAQLFHPASRACQRLALLLIQLGHCHLVLGLSSATLTLGRLSGLDPLERSRALGEGRRARAWAGCQPGRLAARVHRLPDPLLLGHATARELISGQRTPLLACDKTAGAEQVQELRVALLDRCGALLLVWGEHRPWPPKLPRSQH